MRLDFNDVTLIVSYGSGLIEKEKKKVVFEGFSTLQ